VKRKIKRGEQKNRSQQSVIREVKLLYMVKEDNIRIGDKSDEEQMEERQTGASPSKIKGLPRKDTKNGGLKESGGGGVCLV